DDDLLLADQLVDEQRRLRALGLDDDRDVAAAEPAHRQILVANAQRLALAADATHFFRQHAARLDHGGERHRIGLAADCDGHRFDDRERQWHADRDGGALPGLRVELDLAAQELDVPAHHVHADPAAGHVGDALGGGEARLEDELPDFGIGRAVRDRHAALGGACEDAPAIEAAAVIADLDDDAAAPLRRRERDLPPPRPARGLTP